MDISHIKPGHPIWDEIWRRSKPDAPDHANHLEQLFEKSVQYESLHKRHQDLIEAMKNIRSLLVPSSPYGIKRMDKIGMTYQEKKNIEAILTDADRVLEESIAQE